MKKAQIETARLVVCGASGNSAKLVAVYKYDSASDSLSYFRLFSKGCSTKRQYWFLASFLPLLRMGIYSFGEAPDWGMASVSRWRVHWCRRRTTRFLLIPSRLGSKHKRPTTTGSGGSIPGLGARAFCWFLRERERARALGPGLELLKVLTEGSIN
jgi:hypothetical protein